MARVGAGTLRGLDRRAGPAGGPRSPNRVVLLNCGHEGEYRSTRGRPRSDAGLAEDDAQWAEADAYDAVTFAESAIEEAQYALLDAVMARRRANVMAAAT
jgi:hypothetical protein